MWAINGWAALDLTLEGVENEVAENIELHMSQWQSLPSDNLQYIEAELRPTVERALRALGYYQAEIKFQLDGDELTLIIEPGPPVVWDSSDIQLLSEQETVNGELRALADKPPFPAGEPINHQVYENYKRQLLTQAAELGYLDARLQKNRLAVDVANSSAQVTLHLATGPRYKITAVTYDDTALNQTLLEAVAEAPVEEWYSPNRVGSLYNRLLNTGYFTNVTVVTDKRPPNQVHLHVELTDQPSHQIATGVGFATNENGPRFRLRWTRPLVNPAGHSWHSQLKVSQVEQDVTAEYRLPWNHPQDSYIALNTGWQRKDTDELITTLAKTGVSYHRLLPGGWQYSLNVNVEHENTRLGEQSEESYTYVIPGVSLVRRRYHGEPANPSRGYKAWIDFASSREEVGSDTDFRRLDFGVNTVYTLWQRHSLLGRLQWGGIKADDLSEVPPSQRFFTGGDQTLRGYKYETVAPEDLQGNLLGGQYLNLASLEYRYRFLKNWQAALFADTGRVYTEDTTGPLSDSQAADPQEAERLQALRQDDREFKTSVGVGVRWQTPIGAIAFDVAAPLDDDENSFRLHLYLGTSL